LTDCECGADSLLSLQCIACELLLAELPLGVRVHIDPVEQGSVARLIARAVLAMDSLNVRPPHDVPTGLVDRYFGRDAVLDRHSEGGRR
jgi:hypothetical protein